MKYYFTPIILLLYLPASAQNVQLHYEFGQQEDGVKHNYFVSTFELFRPDSLGYTFLFTDFEFNSPGQPRGVSLGYFEIAREFRLPWFNRNLGIHLEYNDGAVIYPINDTAILGENLRNTWLGGIEYTLQLSDLSLNIMTLYKYTRGSETPDFQWTIVWFYPLFRNKISLSGYADVWTQDDFQRISDKKTVVLYSQPQIWYNFNKHFSLGSEFKISRNFIYGSKRVEFFPTLGIKWEF